VSYQYGKNYQKKIKRNLCRAPGCYFPVFSHNYCNRHQYFYAAKQPIPRYKPKKVSKTYVYGFTTLPELFSYCYYHAPRPIVCPVSNENITPLFSQDFDVWKCCCAHVLSRNLYPLWRLNPHNIVLLLPLVHSLLDQGTQKQRDKYPDWNWNYFYELQKQLKDEYQREFTGAEAPDNTTEETANGQE
jgi:hypothetical protein